MKKSKKLLVAAIVVLAVLLILATPTLADKRTLVCDGAPECKINIFAGPTQYPAGEPFYIQHGQGLWPPDDAPIASGHAGFALEVDGVYVEPDWDERYATGANVYGFPIVWQVSAFNFPDGMTGTHTFTGHWYVACLTTEGQCENPMDPIDWFTSVLTVEFVE
jgi:hypothetical protein